MSERPNRSSVRAIASHPDPADSPLRTSNPSWLDYASEGKSWDLNFMSQLAEIDAALRSAGIDTSKPMLAPVRWADDPA